MASEPEVADLKKLEAQLLTERQAYYDRIAAQRRHAHHDLSDERNLEAFLQDRIERLLGTPPTR